MTIEWLNEDRTEARITRGWWRKMEANVRRVDRGMDGWGWKLIPSACPVTPWQRWRLERARRRAEDAAWLAVVRARRDQDWRPVGELPRAEARRAGG